MSILLEEIEHRLVERAKRLHEERLAVEKQLGELYERELELEGWASRLEADVAMFAKMKAAL